MLGVTQPGRQRFLKKGHATQKNQIDRHQKTQRTAVNFGIRVVLFLSKAEISCFQAKYQKYCKETGIGVKLRNDAVFTGRKGIGVKRNQQIIQEPAQNAA